jgi:hypothetical protein
VYLYCGNDPLNAADPYGLWDWAKYFHDVGNVFVGYGQAIWGTLSSPFVIGQYYWENGVSWESTKQLFGGCGQVFVRIGRRRGRGMRRRLVGRLVGC